MPEWESLLRHELGTADVPPERLEEIIAELDGHLESAWEEHGSRGLGTPCPDVFLRNQLGSIARLRARIERAERTGGVVTEPFKHFWISAFLALCLMGVVLWRLVAIAPGTAQIPPGSYPVAFILIGALSAFAARRAGARPLFAFLAGVGPTLMMLVVLASVFSPFGVAYTAYQVVRGLTLPLIGLAIGALAFSGDITEERFRHFWGPAFLAICLSEVAAIWLHASWIPGFPGTIARYGMSLVPGSRYVEVLLIFALIGGLTATLARRNGATRLWAFFAGIAPLWKFALYYLLLIFSAPEPGSSLGFLFVFIWGTLLPVACTAASSYAFSFIPPAKQATHQPC